MTTVIAPAAPAVTAGLPAWTVREPDEPAEDWLLRLVISYAAMEHLAGTRAVNDLGGQDPYPVLGADQNDLDEEITHE